MIDATRLVCVVADSGDTTESTGATDPVDVASPSTDCTVACDAVIEPPVLTEVASEPRTVACDAVGAVVLVEVVVGDPATVVITLPVTAASTTVLVCGVATRSCATEPVNCETAVTVPLPAPLIPVAVASESSPDAVTLSPPEDDPVSGDAVAVATVPALVATRTPVASGSATLAVGELCTEIVVVGASGCVVDAVIVPPADDVVSAERIGDVVASTTVEPDTVSVCTGLDNVVAVAVVGGVLDTASYVAVAASGVTDASVTNAFVPATALETTGDAVASETVETLVDDVSGSV